MGQLEGRRAIVTGGASGMGAATVRAYAAEGAKVVSLDMNAEAGARVAAEAGRDGAAVRFEECNISSDSVFDVMERAVSWLGGLDVLANVAGIERGSHTETLTAADLDELLETNFRGTVRTNQVAFRHMRQAGGGRIINFGSAAGLIGMDDAVAYSLSKAAILGWSRGIAAEWGKYGVAVVAMVPAIWTPMYEAYRRREPERAAFADLMMEGTDPDRDIGPVMVFFAGPGAHAVSGQHIAVGKIGLPF